MVMHLQGRRVVRAAELAAHFEVTERTIYRDISALSEAGVPISGEAGVGYSLHEGLPAAAGDVHGGGGFVAVCGRRAGETVHGRLAARADGLGARKAARGAAARPAGPCGGWSAARWSMGRPGRAAPETAGQRWLLTVQQGVVLRRVLRMAYCGRDREEETQRDVEPQGIVFYGGAWYLVAWCRLRGDFRHFRIDRIRTAGAAAGDLSAARGFFVQEKHMRETDAREQSPRCACGFCRSLAGTGPARELRHAH
jgi:predicted DNA-binding transcriptional regulator YafY